VLSVGEDLQWPNGIQGVHALMHGDEDLDRVVARSILLNDCTHFDGSVWDWMFEVIVDEEEESD